MHEKTTEKCLPNTLGLWSHHVRGASMQYLALSYLLRFCNEDQLKSNKKYGDDLYDFLTLMKTDQEKVRYTFLEDVQQPGRLPEQNGIVEN
jgi:DNA-directed RNA polymerase-5 subunit 1